jgi:hypothetical protein
MLCDDRKEKHAVPGSAAKLSMLYQELRVNP